MEVAGRFEQAGHKPVSGQRHYSSSILPGHLGGAWTMAMHIRRARPGENIGWDTHHPGFVLTVVMMGCALRVGGSSKPYAPSESPKSVVELSRGSC